MSTDVSNELLMPTPAVDLAMVPLPIAAPVVPRVNVLGTLVSATSYVNAEAQIDRWIAEGQGRYVCAANVHMVMEGRDDPSFQTVVNGADLVTPDGRPLVWCLQRWGFPEQQQVKGPRLMPHLVRIAHDKGWRIGFYGSDPETLRLLIERLQAENPDIKVTYAYSPPFRPLTDEEERSVCEAIVANVDILFVGLGCPKQERWMAEHRDRLNCVMIGVGAAFNFHAGTSKTAPANLEKMGLEWLFRLCQEPRRLWRRYAKHNPRFVVLALWSGLTRQYAKR